MTDAPVCLTTRVLLPVGMRAHSVDWRNSVSIRQRDRASHGMSAHSSHAISKFTTFCSNAFPEAANLALMIQTQARSRRTVRTWKLMFAHNQSAWNYQKRFIVNGERQRFLNQSMVVLLNIGGKYSHLRAKPAHFAGHLPAGKQPGAFICAICQCRWAQSRTGDDR